ncbi:MAG: TetR/AcrR family transcriptional regulator [Deltaproteobacteria bacterium]|nr:TetR/AcrR family transcriptional regulator [Deltaproteobacteria bacterium]
MHQIKIKINSDADEPLAYRLLTCAAALFAKKGYAATSVREIVAAAGITKPALYYHYGSKEGLYLAIMEAALDYFRTTLDSFRQDNRTVLQKMVALADLLFSMVTTEMDITRLIYATHYRPPQGSPFFDIHPFGDKLREAILEIVKKGIQEKELRPGDPVDITWAFLGAIHLVMESEICFSDRSPGREGLQRIIELIYDGFSTKGSAGV